MWHNTLSFTTPHWPPVAQRGIEATNHSLRWIVIWATTNGSGGYLSESLGKRHSWSSSRGSLDIKHEYSKIFLKSFLVLPQYGKLRDGKKRGHCSRYIISIGIIITIIIRVILLPLVIITIIIAIYIDIWSKSKRTKSVFQEAKRED